MGQAVRRGRGAPRGARRGSPRRAHEGSPRRASTGSPQRPASGRGARRRSRRRLRPGIGAVLAVLAVALVTLGAPATQLAAQVTAAWTPYRTIGSGTLPATDSGFGTGSDDDSLVDVHISDPGIAGPVIGIPVPSRIDIEIVPPTVPRGQIPEFAPPPAACGGYSSPRQIPPGVEPGPGSATLSWMADSNTAVRGYRVQAVSQVLVSGAQPTPPSAEVAQRTDCGQVSVSITGLNPGEVYVFWLEEAIWDADAEVIRYVQVGSSTPTAVG